MENNQMKFSKVCEEWLCMKRLCVKQSTYANYCRIVNNHILPAMGAAGLCQLNSASINGFILGRIQRGRMDHRGGLSNKTVRDICGVLKSIIRYAQNEYGMGNVAQNVVFPKRTKTEYEVLTQEELKRMELTCRYLPYYANRCAGLLICMYMGLRLGEICALRWKDVDLEQEVIYVRRTMQRIQNTEDTGEGKTQVILDSPKSYTSYRTIPIPQRLLETLRQLYTEPFEEEFFLTDSMQYLEPRTYQYFFKRFLKKAGVRDVKFHIMRHTFASRCVAAGFDVKTLSEILGHSDTAITLNYYVHSNMELKRRQMDILEAELE